MMPRFGILGSALFSIVNAEWSLLHRDQVSEEVIDTSWKKDQSVFCENIIDDNGDWYHNDYGPAFADALKTFDTYVKEIPRGWMTAALSYRDVNKSSVFVEAPSFKRSELTVNDGKRKVGVYTLDSSMRHSSGAILRNTEPLPDHYRIEYKLMSLDFGGKRNGSMTYEDGRVNGYSTGTCKTQHPWGEGSMTRGWNGDASSDYCDWQSVLDGPFGYNGFGFFAIVDFAHPIPRNNHFWHYHRKLFIDSFSQHTDRVGDSDGGKVCNAAINEYYPFSESNYQTVNMLFSGFPKWRPNRGSLMSNAQLFVTSCNGGIPKKGTECAGELIESFLPDDYYTFAIERNATGYTMEVSGRFERSGEQTLRFYRPFVVDDVPIWHYNVKAEEYDGRFNQDLRQDKNWAYGSQVWPDQWPQGSAYPDFFVIGDLYTNCYEGTASVTDLRLYVEDGIKDCKRTLLLETKQVLVGNQTVNVGDLTLKHGNNGSLQLWQFRTGGQKYMIWQSVPKSTTETNDNSIFRSILGKDGNLVTRLVDLKDESEGKILWESNTSDWEEDFYFVRECHAKGGGVAIYHGKPGERGIPIWKEDPLPGKPEESNSGPDTSEL